MKKHIETKRKAELIQKAYYQSAKGISIDQIALSYDVRKKDLQKWLRTYKSYLQGDPMQEKCIDRCIPYFQNGTLDIFEILDHTKKEKKEPRTEVVGVRVTKTMMEKLENKSNEYNLSMSEMISEILTKVIAEQKDKKPTESRTPKISILWGLIKIY